MAPFALGLSCPSGVVGKVVRIFSLATTHLFLDDAFLPSGLFGGRL
jgi:hypothetical protein